MIRLRQEDAQLTTWWGTEVECLSAIARMERAGFLDVKTLTEALEQLEDLRRTWSEVAASSQVREAAKRLLRVHALRADDALQLAAATVAAEGSPASLELVSFDERLRAAAAREGFVVI